MPAYILIPAEVLRIFGQPSTYLAFQTDDLPEGNYLMDELSPHEIHKTALVNDTIIKNPAPQNGSVEVFSTHTHLAFRMNFYEGKLASVERLPRTR